MSPNYLGAQERTLVWEVLFHTGQLFKKDDVWNNNKSSFENEQSWAQVTKKVGKKDVFYTSYVVFLTCRWQGRPIFLGPEGVGGAVGAVSPRFFF
jgi:hypothetical protein